MLDSEFASSLAGSLSIVCWLIVFTPQLWENYSRKSGEGLSMTFLIVWLTGDIFNLVGVILQQLLPTMFLLALWYTVADMGLIWQVVYYRNAWVRVKHMHHEVDRVPTRGSARESDPLMPSRRVSEKIPRIAWSGIFWPVCIVVTTFLSCYCYYYLDLAPPEPDSGLLVVSQLLGWSSAALYVGSRAPQILKNHAEQSTEGLSMGMFICAVFGNVLFASSIFLHSTNPHYLLINLSWIIGALGTLVFDFIIFMQFFLYKKVKLPCPNEA